ncbi:hypothetical protein MXB_4648 [Myxobolus squamalis]|nr:hypothetical protein MXB_4648 [Myxobolus squamalis]
MIGSSILSSNEKDAVFSFEGHLICEMACFCFDVLIRYLRNLNPPDHSHLPQCSTPLFVSWRSTNRKLRGCIGTFKPDRFQSDLIYYAVASAVYDTRFPPIQYSEISNLECSVSVLVCFEVCTTYQDWMIGTHGVQITFKQSNRDYSATYLPDVPIEQGWDHYKTIHSLIRKSGYQGPICHFFLRSVKIIRYNSVKASATYQDYLESKFYKTSDPPEDMPQKHGL